MHARAIVSVSISVASAPCARAISFRCAVESTIVVDVKSLAVRAFRLPRIFREKQITDPRFFAYAASEAAADPNIRMFNAQEIIDVCLTSFLANTRVKDRD